MMNFIDIPTEQTTAATDLVLSLLALTVSLVVCGIGRLRDPKKAGIWAWAFGLLALAAIIGVAAHGFKMMERTNFILWQPINLALGLSIALFVVGVVYDMRGFSIPRALLPIVLAVGVVFYAVTLLVPGTFIVFILYEAVAMLFALVSYTVLAFRKKLNGSWFMAVGILVTIVAAAIQATEAIRIQVIWEFDHNGVFHLVQMIGLVFLLLGLRTELLSRPAKENVSR